MKICSHILFHLQLLISLLLNSQHLSQRTKERNIAAVDPPLCDPKAFFIDLFYVELQASNVTLKAKPNAKADIHTGANMLATPMISASCIAGLVK